MYRRLLFAAALLLPFAAAAEPPYVGPKQVDLTILLPPPIVAGSAADRAEIQTVIAAQKAATPERIALAEADVTETVFAMFGRALGPNFAPDKLPRATAFFTRVTESEDDTVDPAKKYFGRVRPFLATPDIKALITPSKSGAYPSGHTTRVTMCAIIVAAILPEKRDAIWARADEYATSRIIGGMHYPNDIEAGRRAGTAMAAVMFSDPAFRADFEAAKAELRATMGM